jgi:hypothetical protein
MKAVIYANDLKQVQAGMKYAAEKGYQVIAMKNAGDDIIGEGEMDVLLIVANRRAKRTYDEILFIEKMQNWYEVEVVEVEGGAKR